MVNNGLTSYFALWSDKETDKGFYLTYDSTFVYNNIVLSGFETHSPVSPNQANALIIKNIPLTSINEIQALIYYNRTGINNATKAIGLIIEIYNSITDPNLNEVLANTIDITTASETYRFNFPSISTYTNFVGVISNTNIVNDTFALTEDANVISFPTEITGDLVVVGDLTANNVIVGSTNLVTEINTKQDLITTAMDLDCNSLITTNLEVNGGVNIDTNTYFDTIVIRRPTGLTGAETSFTINLNELQVWINGSNILPINASILNSYFSLSEARADGPTSNMYNNQFETSFGTHSKDADALIENALIITNLSLTAINAIQSIVLYNSITNPLRTIGLAIELNNSINDPDLTEVLATTNVITSAENIYRFDFPSLSTYTGSFASVASTTLIVNNSVALREDAIFTDCAFEITGDVVANGVNINTTLADILSRLELLENS